MKQLFFTILAMLILNATYGQVKATSAEINTGTDDAKFATALALQGSKYLDQNGAKLSAVTAAGANTYTASIVPAITAYNLGQVFYIKITTANTGASTLNLNGLGAKTLVKDASTALASGDLLANKVYAVYYDGTNFQVLNAAAIGTNNQTLSFGATAGNLAISGGNNVTISSVGSLNKPDANTILTAGLFPFINTTGSTNYAAPFVGGGFSFNRTGGTALGQMDFWSRSDSNEDLVYFRTGSGASSFNSWKIIADRAWSNSNFLKAGHTDGGYSPAGYTGDMNLITTNQMFYATLAGGTNAPIPSGFNGMIQSYGRTINYGTQLAISNGPDGMFFRANNNGVWGNWYQAASRDWVSANYSNQIQGSSRFLPRSLYNYNLGAFIQTDIPTNAMFTLHIKGNGYSSPNSAFTVDVQGYNYETSNSILSAKAISVGNPTPIDIFYYNGFVCFWYPQIGGASQTIEVVAYSGTPGNIQVNGNRITSITNEAKPATGITRNVTVTPSVSYTDVDPVSKYVIGTNSTILATDNIAQAFGKVQAQINATNGAYLPLTGGTLQSATANKLALRKTADLQGNYLQFQNTAGAQTGYVGHGGSTNDIALVTNLGAISLYANGATRLVIENTGVTSTVPLNGTSANFTGSVTAPTFIGNLTGNASSVAWTGVSGKPTTLTGYGITDGATQASVTTLDANVVHKAGNETIAGVKLFSTSIGIGTTNVHSYKLAVGGGIIAESVKVKPQGSWPDYVFEEDYPILPLNELELFVLKNKHLPNVPNAAEVKKEGIELGEMNAKLLRKIEELTLYIIEQQKAFVNQEGELKDLKERIKSDDSKKAQWIIENATLKDEMKKLSEVVGKLSAEMNSLKSK